MSRIYARADYEGVVDDDYHGNVLSWIDHRLSVVEPGLRSFQNNKILIAGCGYGYLVQRLMDVHGFTDVWGCDASAWAIQQAKALHPHLAARFVQADITVRQQLTALRSAAGLSGNQSFRAVVTEDVLPCAANQAEAQTMLTELRRISQGEGHIISMRFPDGTVQPDGSVVTPWGGVSQMPGFLWLTPAAWRALIGTSAWIYTAQGEQVP
jgi:2-polyprenyl-3-methyl-5-hydroxy-6-metoxy-1,4-benzoquinol methylase